MMKTLKLIKKLNVMFRFNSIETVGSTKKKKKIEFQNELNKLKPFFFFLVN